MVLTAISLATSPAACPPMPSETTSSVPCARACGLPGSSWIRLSSLPWRTRPGFVSPTTWMVNPAGVRIGPVGVSDSAAGCGVGRGSSLIGRQTPTVDRDRGVRRGGRVRCRRPCAHTWHTRTVYVDRSLRPIWSTGLPHDHRSRLGNRNHNLTVPCSFVEGCSQANNWGVAFGTNQTRLDRAITRNEKPPLRDGDGGSRCQFQISRTAGVRPSRALRRRGPSPARPRRSGSARRPGRPDSRRQLP